MTSTFVNDLRLNEMATGDQSGSWGTVTNTNLELIGEALGYGTEGITTNANTHTSTIADGATDPVRALYVEYTGTLDSACTITIAPNTVNKVCFIENGTSGSQNIIIKQGSGATITIPPGDTKAVYLDGAGSGAKVVDAFASLSVVDLNVSGNLDVDGTANLDAVDIDGAVQIDNTVSVGVNDTGYDVKFFGDTASAFMLWDASADDLILGGAAGLSVNSAALVTGVLTTTAATVFNGGFTANEVSTISDATSFSSGLTIANTADTHGSVIDFFNNSSSPADNDYIGGLIFKETNSAGGTHSYAKIFGQAVDITDGTEDGAITFETSAAGANTAEIMRITNASVDINTSLNLTSTAMNIDFMETGVTDSNHRIRQNSGNLSFGKLSNDKNTFTENMLLDGGAGTIFNNGGADLDFRVATDNNTHTFFVAGDTDLIGIGGVSVPDGQFTIPSTNSDTPRIRFQHPSVTGDASIDTFQDGGGTYLSIGQNSYFAANGAQEKFNSGEEANQWYFDPSGVIVGFTATAAGGLIERMRVTSTAGANLRVSDGIDILDGNVKVASGHGIDFSATGDATGATAELLDDYEEGTWTPVITAEGSSAASITVNTATYTRVGRLVSLVFRLTINSISGTSSSNAIELTGMPFTINDANSGGANIGYTGLTASMSGTLALQGNTTTKYRIVNLTGLSGSNASDHLTGNSSLRAQFTYHSD